MRYNKLEVDQVEEADSSQTLWAVISYICIKK
jgi:hypothetical protein